MRKWILKWLGLDLISLEKEVDHVSKLLDSGNQQLRVIEDTNKVLKSILDNAKHLNQIILDDYLAVDKFKDQILIGIDLSDKLENKQKDGTVCGIFLKSGNQLILQELIPSKIKRRMSIETAIEELKKKVEKAIEKQKEELK